MSAVDVEKLVEDRVAELLAKFPPESTSPTEFWGAQFDCGLAWVHFPEGHGGLNLPPQMQKLVDARLSEAGAPSNRGRNLIGLGMGAPTVVSHGRDDQRKRYLRPLFTCEEIWCQLFSEPGAGSDLAGLATRAIRDGDEWIVNGQKVWTTLAHQARWGMLLARTDPDVPKHNGMTYFVLDLHAPGVEVRPLRQITGEAEFNEVFLNDVRIPDSDRLGEVGRGWSVAVTTLMNERASITSSAAPARGSGPIGTAVQLWHRSERKSPAVRDELVKLWIRSEVNRLTSLRARQARALGNPGPEGSVGKLAWAETSMDIQELCVDLLGAEGTLYSSYEMARPDRLGSQKDDIARAFLHSRSNAIAGGTSEVMRNILGERVLGLPGDDRRDRELPWSQVPRS
ncbi:MAG TPA: acyl-CoA dehydrogenase family protein [Acidimicrobiales bacterium]|nr:acyl-CoA dehydrogenase family protein [Acidimicrobiales bacterium]